MVEVDISKLADALVELGYTLERKETPNDVRTWPEDEAAAYRQYGGFQQGTDAARAVRVDKLARLLFRETMIHDPEGQRLVDEILARKALEGVKTRPLPAARPHTKPYSPEDYLEAKTRGLDLDEWADYQTFYELGQ